MQRDGCQVSAYWADEACIDEDGVYAEAEEIAGMRAASGWNGLYFGGTASKKPRDIDPARNGDAAREACPFMDVITTSVVATGQESNLGKIETFRASIGDRPLALASGISPENATSYADVDCFMVATGINVPGNFYDVDPARLAQLMSITRTLSNGSHT